MEYKDYYKILGVSRDAKEDEIKKSYRKLARKYHPDVTKEADRAHAEEQFKAVQEAYEVLKDAKKRAAYDQLGSNWQSGQEFRPPPNWQGFSGFGDAGGFEDLGGGGADFSDFFASIFGGGRARQGGFHRAGRGEFSQRGQDESAKIAVSLSEAFHGGTKTVRLQVHEMDSQGQPHAKIRTLKITIPKGVVSGQQLRLAQQGSPGIGKGPAGDLFLEIEVTPDSVFTLQGRDIYLTLPVTPWEAALGATVKVPTLAGPVEMKIASGAQAGQKLRLKGRGLPGNPSAGDQYILLQIVTPPAHTDAQRALYEKMAQEMPFDPRKHLLGTV